MSLGFFPRPGGDNVAYESSKMQNIILLNTVSNASRVQAHQAIYLLVLTYQQLAVLLKREKKKGKTATEKITRLGPQVVPTPSGTQF